MPPSFPLSPLPFSSPMLAPFPLPPSLPPYPSSSSSSSSSSSTRRHRTKALFSCPTCSKTFPRHQHLLRHQRKHNGEKPFQCLFSSCGRRFTRYDNMLQHYASHYDRGHRRKKKIMRQSIARLITGEAEEQLEASDDGERMRRLRPEERAAVNSLVRASFASTFPIPIYSEGWEALRGKDGGGDGEEEELLSDEDDEPSSSALGSLSPSPSAPSPPTPPSPPSSPPAFPPAFPPSSAPFPPSFLPFSPFSPSSLFPPLFPEVSIFPSADKPSPSFPLPIIFPSHPLSSCSPPAPLLPSLSRHLREELSLPLQSRFPALPERSPLDSSLVMALLPSFWN